MFSEAVFNHCVFKLPTGIKKVHSGLDRRKREKYVDALKRILEVPKYHTVLSFMSFMNRKILKFAKFLSDSELCLCIDIKSHAVYLDTRVIMGQASLCSLWNLRKAWAVLVGLCLSNMRSRCGRWSPGAEREEAEDRLLPGQGGAAVPLPAPDRAGRPRG